MTVRKGTPVGILPAFGSLVAAQAIGAGLGLVFWITVARLVPAEEVGVSAAAISTQTLLGSVASLGVGTLLIAELGGLDTADRRRVLARGLAAVLLVSALLGAVFAALSGLMTQNLDQALSSPAAVVTFVAGVAAASAALVVDQAGLGVGRSRLQVGRSLLASGLRFPLAAGLLWWGARDSLVLQLCWVVPLWISIGFSLARLRLGPRRRGGPGLRQELRRYAGPALRNHALSLALAAGSQLVPVLAALTLPSVDNASFAIAWLLASFVFLPPYLLATALFAHGANTGAEEFRRNMQATVPAALTLSLALCVGAWVLGRPMLGVFGAHYAERSTLLLAILVPAGLWMVLKDHLVAFWRSQRRFGTGLRLTLVALALEVLGAGAGGLLGGAVGLCAGWLAAAALEVVVFAPWLREAFGGLTWQSPHRLVRGWGNG
jgi:O-antigen/teichoic acid export membrane protein